MKRTGLILTVVGLVLIAAWFEPSGVVRGAIRGEPFFAGRPSSIWRQRLQDSNPQTVAEARRKLKDGRTEALPVLIAIAREPGGEWTTTAVRVSAIEMIRDQKAEARPAVPDLILAMVDPDPAVSSAAAEALSVIAPEDPAVIGAFLKQLSGPNVRAALRGLAAGKETAGVATSRAIELLRHDDPDIRWNAARTLGKIRAVEAIDPIIAQLHDPAEAVREHAAEALGDIGPPAAKAVAPLIDALKDPYVKTRRDAARALGQIGPAAKAAIPALEKAAKDDPEEMVRSAAAAAIKRLNA